MVTLATNATVSRITLKKNSRKRRNWPLNDLTNIYKTVTPGGQLWKKVMKFDKSVCIKLDRIFKIYIKLNSKRHVQDAFFNLLQLG